MRAILKTRKETIINKWYQCLLESYPPETARFLKEEGNQFANPVGTTIYRGLEGLCQELLRGGEGDGAKIKAYLDSIIRIRAIQDFSPSQALAFIFQLKQVAREELTGAIQARELSLEELEKQVDDLALLAFDIYMQCREQLYEIRVKEVKARTARLLQRANLA